MGAPHCLAEVGILGLMPLERPEERGSRISARVPLEFSQATVGEQPRECTGWNLGAQGCAGLSHTPDLSRDPQANDPFAAGCVCVSVCDVCECVCLRSCTSCAPKQA